MVGIGFCGCSLTEGVPNVEVNECYANIVSNYFKPDLFLNYAKGGSSNRDIFLQAMEMVLTEVNYILVQWSHPGRQRWNSGFDRLVTTVGDYNNPLKNILSDKNFKNFVDVFKIVDNTYSQYFELNTQITILNKICKKLNKSVYYINGGMHIDPMFLNKIEISNAYEQLLPYSCDIINLQNLPDNDIEKSIQEIRNLLSVINKTQWVDVETIARVDYGYDNRHPGPESNIITAKKVTKFLEDKIK